MSVRTLFRINDPGRLAAVHATGLLDTEPEPTFDELVSSSARFVGRAVCICDDSRRGTILLEDADRNSTGRSTAGGWRLVRRSAANGRSDYAIIGDVGGHDIGAAVVMGQLRNLLRVLAWEHNSDTPAELITRLDGAMPEHGLRTMATLIVARIEQTSADTGLRTLRWSSAGHPVAVLLDGDGHSRLLQARPDPPLGVGTGRSRNDHVIEIGRGQTLLLYTDGLIETRTDAVDDRMHQLVDLLESLAGVGLDGTFDVLVTGRVGDAPEDDVALIAVRFPPEGVRSAGAPGLTRCNPSPVLQMRCTRVRDVAPVGSVLAIATSERWST